MRHACIDIGSNTTRLLVADCTPNGLREVRQERVFTQIARGRLPDGSISSEKIQEVAGAVSGQLLRARELGADTLRAVATAAIRRAPNGCSLADAVREACGLEVEILSWQEEARLAFVGVARMLEHPPTGDLGVIDVGGGSSELVVGTSPGTISWSTSLPVGSGDLTRSCLTSDPPAGAELAEARRRVTGALDAVEVPKPSLAAAVGGSAASLATLAGTVLDQAALTRSLELLASEPAALVAGRYGLAEERVRLLPAGLLILQGAGERFGLPLNVGRGGLREGILLEGCLG
ncbi:MAG: hypothetical protein ACJ764_10890 [Solirubrobacteraceae bacterium]